MPVCYAQRVKRQSIAIIGAGRLGAALAKRLAEAGFTVSIIRSRTTRHPAQLRADVAWFCVPDGEIARVARNFSKLQWADKFAFHSSGVLSSDVLVALRKAGAHVASVHPLMTFVKGSVPELAGVPFAIEGDQTAVRVAREIVRKLGAEPSAINKANKVAYHAFATMICPLLVSLLAAAEKVADLAGISEREARRRMMPIIRQTLRNYEKLGPARSFSGPIVRGDLETVRAHFRLLTKIPAARNAYTALALAALEHLPNRNPQKISRLLKRNSL